jgi:hypothetical protein
VEQYKVITLNRLSSSAAFRDLESTAKWSSR